MEDQTRNQSEQQAPLSPAQPQIDQFELESLLRKLQAEQNLGLGIVGGVIGMLIGAMLWAAITVITDYQIGYMAIGVGFLVGVGVRFLGKGLDKSFGLVGGGLALVGCLLGNLLTVLIVVSREFEVSFFDLLINLNFEIVVEFMKVTFSPIDLLFYGLAVYAGYRYAFKRVTKEELARLEH